MENHVVHNYLESIIIEKSTNKPMDHIYKRLKIFFENITSVVFEDNLSIILLNNNLEIITVSPKDNKNYDYLYGKQLQLDLSQEDFKTDKLKDNKVFIYSSPILYVNSEDISYKFVLLSLNHKLDKLKDISDRLKNSLNNLYSYHKKETDAYHNLLHYLDSIDEGISACDKNGKLTYINKSACTMLNTTKEDILDRDVKTLTPHSILMKTIKDEKAYLDMNYYIDYNNKLINLMSSAYPVYDKDNNIIGAIDIYKKIKRSIKLATKLAGYNAKYEFHDFIGDSKALSNAIKISKKFAHSNKNILITGDSGTGKELFAQSIHNYSTRREGPFVAINCASYPRDLFESELFGYEEGAFTGAKKGGKTGKFELADGGTIFLDEIGEMPLNLQAKLLRVIETKNIMKIGSNKNINIDVRIISATNRNLEDMIKNNRFREDLYYRLKILYLHLEPLKNREDDSIILCNYFIQKSTKDSSKKIKGLSHDAIQYIKEYDWPGNIRELENYLCFIVKAIILQKKILLNQD